MNIENANVLSWLSGSENLGNFPQGLLAGSGEQLGFSAAFMDQLRLLQSSLANATNGQAPQLLNLQGAEMSAANVDSQTAMQNFAALFGNTLPLANKIDQNIDLDDTLQTLADVMQQLQELEASAENAVTAPLPLPAKAMAQQALDTDDKELAGDDQIAAKLLQESMPVIPGPQQPAAMPVPTADTADNADAGEFTELAISLSAAKKNVTPAVPQVVKDKIDLTLSSQKENDPATAFDRTIAAMLGEDAATGDKTQQNNPVSDVKSQSVVTDFASQIGNPLESEKSAATTMAADIAKLNAAVRAEYRIEQPAMTKTFADPAWNQELGEKLIWMHKQDMPSAELRLNPEHLGPVLIKIDVKQDQTSVVFTTQHLAVKEAIEAAIPKLREMFGGQQLNLADVNVSQHQSDQRQPARDFFQAASEQNRNRQAEAGDASENTANPSNDILDEIEAGRAIASNGLLSLFA